MNGYPRPIARPLSCCRRGVTGSGFRAITIPALPPNLGGVVASEVAIGQIAFRHEPTGARGEVAGHLHPKARVSTRGRSVERRCFACDGRARGDAGVRRLHWRAQYPRRGRLRRYLARRASWPMCSVTAACTASPPRAVIDGALSLPPLRGRVGEGVSPRVAALVAPPPPHP